MATITTNNPIKQYGFVVYHSKPSQLVSNLKALKRKRATKTQRRASTGRFAKVGSPISKELHIQ